MEISYLGSDKVRIAGRNVKMVASGSTIEVDGLTIDSPGEYEVKGSMITGVPVGEDTAYVIHGDDVSVGVLANANEELGAEALEQLSELDALVVAAERYEIVGKLEPKYVIPMGDGAAVKKFLDELGAATNEPQAKLKLNGRDVPEETTVVALTPAA